MVKHLYGLRDGKIVSISDISIDQKGLKCECICPSCKGKLEACSLQGKVARYFRHFTEQGDVYAACDAVHANQSALHMLAKEILKEETFLAVPSVKIERESILTDLPGYIVRQLPPVYEFKKVTTLEITSVREETQFGSFIPDIILDTPSGYYLIEIAVTHFVDPDKAKKVANNKIPMLEIDLSGFVNREISRENLRKHLVYNIFLKKWIYYPHARNYAKAYYERQSAVLRYRFAIKARERTKDKLTALMQPSNYVATLSKLRNDTAFGAKAKILYPQSVADQCKQLCLEAMSQY